jgi:hypothetical protein
LNIRLEIGNNQEPIDLTFDTLYIPDKEKYPELANINFNGSKRPFFHRYKKYKRSVLSAAGYPGVLVYFFDQRKFKDILTGTDTSSSANDDILRENIYLTLYYLFPTGYPSVGNIHFSSNKIAGGGMGFAPEGGLGVLNFLKEPAPITGVQNAVEKNWWQNILETFQGKRIFSYVKRDKTYTISEAIWKNDLYNHPTYRNFLRSIYTYISWGVRYQKSTIMVGTKNTDGKIEQKSVLKMDNNINLIRKEFINSFKNFITHNIDKICNNKKGYENIRNLIVELKLLYVISEIIADRDKKEKELDNEINIQIERNKNRDSDSKSYYTEQISNKKRARTIFQNETDKILQFFDLPEQTKILEIKNNNFKIEEVNKDENKEEKNTIFVINKTNLTELNEKSERGYEKNEDEKNNSIKEIRDIYRKRVIFEELRILKTELRNKKDSHPLDEETLLNKFAKYVFFLDAKDAIEQNKMVPIQTAYLINDKYYKNAFESGTELEPIKRLYNTDYREFQRELGGDEGTNPVLNRIIYDFLNGQSSELAECAIWFHHFILEDKSLLIEPAKLKEIESSVQSFNSNWQNIYTGIRAEYSMTQQMISDNKQSSSSRSSNEYTIFVCLNGFDQELNEETLDTFKCFIQNHSIGDMALQLFNKSSDVKEESIRDKFLIHSVIQNIPSSDNQTLKEKVKSMKEGAKKQPPVRRPGVPVAPMRQQGGKTFRPRPRPRHKTFRRRRPYFNPAT